MTVDKIEQPKKALSHIFYSKILFVFSLIVLILAIFSSRISFPRLSLIATHLTGSANTITATSRSAITTTSTPKMASSQYAKELEVAQLAVQRAARLTKRVFHEKAKGTVSKDDKSPVTIGDFGAQKCGGQGKRIRRGVAR